MTPRPFPDRLIPLAQLSGASLGLFAFGVMILRGLWSGNPVETILARALAGLVAATILGCAVGALAERVIREAAAGNRPAETPTPKNAQEDATPSGG